MTLKKIKTKKSLKLLAFSALGLAAALPLAITVACGEMTETVVSSTQLGNKDQAQTYLDSEIASKVTVTSDSTPSSVSWVGSTPLPANLVNDYNLPEYSVRSYLTAAAAISDTEKNDWSVSLPKVVAHQAADRYLWVRITHRSEPTLSIAENLTESSKVRTVKYSGVVQTASNFLYSSLVPLVKADLTNSNPGAMRWLYELPALPTDVALNYNNLEFTQGASFGDEHQAELNQPTANWSTSLPSTINSRGDKRNLWARLTPKTSLVQTVVINLSTSSNIRDVKETKPFLEVSARDFLVNVFGPRLSVNLAASTFPNIVWNPYDVALPDALYDYYTLEFNTNAVTTYVDDKQAAQDQWLWPLVLPPTKIEGPANLTDPAKLRLWVRLKSRDQNAYSSIALELTTQSKINQVKAA